MKHTKISLLIAGFLTASTIVPNTAVAADATATATATIIKPIAISKDTDMNFGQVYSSATGGTVVLSTADNRTPTDVTLGSASGVTAAVFTVTGEGTNTYTITLPSSDVILDDNASHTMTASSFTSDPSGTGTLAAGTQTLRVGATLTVGANQASGTYTTDTPFTVTVVYQ